LAQPGGGILHITPFGTPDTRLKDITVQQLMDHQGGWDRDASGDPMFESIMIANALGVPSPPSQTDTVRYMMGRPLDFTPGTKTVYSNFGYLLLGLIVEQITGTDYTAWVQQQILNPQGAASTEIQLGHSLPAQRNSREPWYSDFNTAPNVFNPSVTVSSPDGGFYLEAMEAHGGLISSARAVAQFLRGYWISGFPRDNSSQEWLFFGSLPGTYALAHQRPDNVNIVVLMNQRADDDSYSFIKQLTDSAADSIVTWPTSNLEQLVAARPRINIDIHIGGIFTGTENGRMYQLQGTTDLVNWFNIGKPVVGDGTQLNLSFPTGAQRMFFRMNVE
jgi:Beta-lactamase